MPQPAHEDIHFLSGLDTAEFVCALKQHDEKAWDVLDSALRGPVCEYLKARILITCPGSAEDVYQEMLTAAYKNIHLFKQGHLKAWLFEIARNKALNYCRRLARDRTLASNCPPKTQPVDGQVSVIPPQVLDKLPERLKRVIVLRFYRGYRIRQIARTMQISVRTVNRYMEEALRRLRQILKEEYEL